jgi:hypothetical protein
MIEFEVMIRPAKALTTPVGRNGLPNSSRPQAADCRFRPISGPFWGYRVLAPTGGLWQEPARLLGLFWADSPVIPGMLP